MSGYIENPKLKGSGMCTCIPQDRKCPIGCRDCFFQSGRSYLEPLEENLPNIPSPEQVGGRIVRVNDGNDSNVDREKVLGATRHFPLKFFNTSIPRGLEGFGDPVVLTLNPADMTDREIHILDPVPENLMFVRVRTNTWNLHLVQQAVDHYTPKGIPVVLTFMAYFNEGIKPGHEGNYIYRKRTLNSYWAITSSAWEEVYRPYKFNPLVHTCGGVEGEKAKTSCRHCGTCLREFYATMERLGRI